MKEKFRQFMTGRYGADQLSRFIMACGMVTLVCYMIFRGSLWYYLTLISSGLELLPRTFQKL